MNNDLPNVAVLVAAYNEADYVIDKVTNCFELDYPKEKVSYHFVTDGSTDGTESILKEIAGINVYHSPERQGKLAAVERVMKFIKDPIVLSTDANCMLNENALRNIVRHYVDPSVGAVCGEKKIQSTQGSGSSDGEGLYWKYESWMRQVDSDLYSVVGAIGEIFSFRRELFETLPSDTIIEDLVLSMRIAMKGYRVVYEPTAIATEYASATIYEEWERKVRICAGGFQAVKYLPGILNPFKYGWLSIQFISHRFLRWSIVPFILPIVMVLLFLLGKASPLYAAIFTICGSIILIATAALLLSPFMRIPKLLLIPGYILMMNASAYVGLKRYLKGTQSQVWEKANRIKSIVNALITCESVYQ